eukprot:12292658-Karenia_brevis.AAC.1
MIERAGKLWAAANRISEQLFCTRVAFKTRISILCKVVYPAGSYGLEAASPCPNVIAYLSVTVTDI